MWLTIQILISKAQVMVPGIITQKHDRDKHKQYNRNGGVYLCILSRLPSMFQTLVKMLILQFCASRVVITFIRKKVISIYHIYYVYYYESYSCIVI